MTHQLIEDKNRRAVTLTTSAVGEVVPEYFEENNSQLISLLEKYYDHLDSDGAMAFGAAIRDLHHIRDVAETRESYLDELIREVGNGLQASSFFDQPRLMARLLAGFYRAKGTLVSAEGFFRGFFNEEVTIEYPKDRLFIVGESQCGYDAQKFIQDDYVYQLFSILVKVGISTQDYESLYKRFVHPAGWYFAGQVLSVENAILPLTVEGLDPLEQPALPRIFQSEASLGLLTMSQETTALIDSGGTQFRAGVTQLVSVYTGDSSITAGSLATFYPTVIDLITPNSFTFDDSSNDARPDMSMTLETMDNDMFTRYSANILDSAI
jgi:hypothetical protein